jgi:tetratricopeptide (TPR) repeat protein
MFRRKSSRRPDVPAPAGDPERTEFYSRGVTRLWDGDTEEARQWLTAAAATEDPTLLFSLGVALAEIGPQSLAISCYERAGRAGHVDAMNNLGVLLKQKNRWDEAERWLRAAAATGDRDALNNLGNILQVTNRTAEAIDCYDRSARAGNVEAMLSLGGMHLNQGDVKRAKKAFQKADRHGHPAARLMLEVADQIVQGQPAPPMTGPRSAPPVRIDTSDLPGAADAMRIRAQATGDPDLLNAAISMAREAVDVTGPEPEGQALALTTLCVTLRVRAGLNDDSQDLHDAIAAGRSAVTAADACGRHGPRCRAALAMTLLDAHQRGEPDRLGESLDLNRAVVAELDIDDAEYPAALANLVNTLVVTFGVEGDPDLLDEAVVEGREAVRLAPHRNAARGRMAMAVSQALMQQALHSQSMDRLIEAHRLGHEALDDTPAKDLNRAAIEQYVARLDQIFQADGS